MNQQKNYYDESFPPSCPNFQNYPGNRPADNYQPFPNQGPPPNYQNYQGPGPFQNFSQNYQGYSADGQNFPGNFIQGGYGAQQGNPPPMYQQPNNPSAQPNMNIPNLSSYTQNTSYPPFYSQSNMKPDGFGFNSYAPPNNEIGALNPPPTPPPSLNPPPNPPSSLNPFPNPDSMLNPTPIPDSLSNPPPSLDPNTNLSTSLNLPPNPPTTYDSLTATLPPLPTKTPEGKPAAEEPSTLHKGFPPLPPIHLDDKYETHLLLGEDAEEQEETESLKPPGLEDEK